MYCSKHFNRKKLLVSDCGVGIIGHESSRKIIFYHRSLTPRKRELNLDDSLETKITLHVLVGIVDRIEELKQHVK